MCEDSSRNCSCDCFSPMPANLLWLMLVMKPSHNTSPLSSLRGVQRMLTHLILPLCAITMRPSQFQRESLSAETHIDWWKEARSLGYKIFWNKTEFCLKFSGSKPSRERPPSLT